MNETTEVTEDQKAGARRTVVVLAIVALVLYVGFYVMVLNR